MYIIPKSGLDHDNDEKYTEKKKNKNRTETILSLERVPPYIEMESNHGNSYI